jgi:acyl-CoA thioesterase-1
MKITSIATSILAAMAILLHAAEKTDLPNVLIIGDSISIGYTRPLKDILQGKANVMRNPGNALDSGNGLEKLDEWLGDTKWAVIHFNHGLHDLKYVDEKGNNQNTKENAHIQIPLEKYKQNMECIVARLKKTGAKVIFATTTPYPAGVKPLRIPEDAANYNEVALGIMKKNGVIVNDLYTYVLPQCEALQKPRNVHFTEDGSKALAQEAAKHILKAIDQQYMER